MGDRTALCPLARVISGVSRHWLSTYRGVVRALWRGDREWDRCVGICVSACVRALVLGHYGLPYSGHDIPFGR